MENIRDIYNYFLDKKCKDIAIYDLSKEGQSFDYLVALTTSSVVNNKKLALQLMEDIGLEKYPEGYNKGEWIVYDFDSIVIHSFLPTTRAKYNVDRVWQSKRVDEKLLKGEE